MDRAVLRIDVGGLPHPDRNPSARDAELRVPHDDVDRRQRLEEGPSIGRQEPLFLVVQQEMRVELRVRGHGERAVELLFELVALAYPLQMDRQSMAPRILAERVDALQQDLQEPLRFLGTAVAIVDRVRHDDVRPGAEAREGVDQRETVQGRVRVDVARHRDGQGGSRAVGDVVHHEIPESLERLVRVDAQPEGMGEDVPLFRERFADRLRRRQLERPSTPGREWRASVGVVRRFHEALKEVLLETVADGVGVDGIRGFQSWFFGGRWLCLRRAARGHEVNPSPTVPRDDYQVFSCYECYRMIRFE